MKIIIELFSDYKDLNFQTLFLAYFQEIGVIFPEGYNVFDDIALSAINEKMMTLVAKDSDQMVAFLMFQPETFTSSSNFFKQSTIFIREFSVKLSHRKHGIGKQLMESIFDYAKANAYHSVVLTTTTAKNFYLSLGFVEDNSYQAKNKQPVFIKHIE